MNPRPYQLGQRQAAVDATRRKVLDAARALLSDPDGSTNFTVDAVAKRADVARATVYYRFESRSGLLEALFDALAADGRMADLAGAFTHPDPAEALRRFVACFVRFWASDRLVLRRIRAIAQLDPEVGAAIAARDERRRTGLQVLAARFGDTGSSETGSSETGSSETGSSETGSSDAAQDGASDRMADRMADRVDVMHSLTSFETFDALAGPHREPDEVIPLVADLVLRVMTGD